MNKKRWINAEDKSLPLDMVKYPWGTITLQRSHETYRGINPPAEITRVENPYPYESTFRADHTNDIPGKVPGVMPISVTQEEI